MGAAIQRIRHHISHWPLLAFLRDREPVPESPEATDEAAFRFKECEDDCGPSANEIQAKERERAERFKCNQLLPIMGIAGPPA